MGKLVKYRLRIVYEKLESAFGEYGIEKPNPYYDGLVNYEIPIDPEAIKSIELESWDNKEHLKEWRSKLDKKGQMIKSKIESFLEINESMYEYYVGLDEVSLYLSFVKKSDFDKWNRERIIDSLL